MERVLSDEEKFRKAEEIYNRRRNMNITVPTRDINRSEPKKDLKRFRKMLIQIGVCIIIYFSIYIIQYSNYFFSNDVIKKIEMVLAYDINFDEKFKEFNEFIKNNKFFNGMFFLSPQENSENSIDEIIEGDSLQDGAIIENTISGDLLNVEGTGGGQSENINSSEEQMKQDAQAIKDNYQITLPLRGTITSRYGEREIEPKFHTGIDVARNAGSEIISVTNGTVILAEEQVSYGKVLKIQNNDLVLLYAHCQELLVNVGDKVNMMQKIATVGSTGNSTGPHLHFEIIYCGRYVNPEYVIEFKE